MYELAHRRMGKLCVFVNTDSSFRCAPKILADPLQNPVPARS